METLCVEVHCNKTLLFCMLCKVFLNPTVRPLDMGANKSSLIRLTG